MRVAVSPAGTFTVYVNVTGLAGIVVQAHSSAPVEPAPGLTSPALPASDAKLHPTGRLTCQPRLDAVPLYVRVLVIVTVPPAT